MYFSWFFMENILMVIFVLVNIAFITLMERKILGFSQMRLGPNKPSAQGLLQPMADAVKLFTKEYVLNLNLHKLVFYSAPALSLLIILSLWQINFAFSHSGSYGLGVIMILMFLGLNSYPTIFSGWASSSKYTLLGSIRSVSQSISYEISLAFLLMTVITSTMSINLSNMSFSMYYYPLILLFPMVLYFLLISMVAESNRTPFDFAEGESELVSGFNTEYGGGGFAVIFMAEYGSIYFLASVSVWLCVAKVGIFFYISTTLLIFLWVWLRSTYPRYRYDLLMNLAWKTILPLSLIYLLLSLVVIVYI